MSTKNMAESLLAERDVDCRAYEAMGCHSVTYSDEHGCIQEIYRFRVWAPRATAVYVTGDFNGWSNASPMHRVGEEGIWTAEIDRGAFSSRGLYKYRIVTQNGEFLKADPYSIAFEMPPATASCAELLPDYPWRDGGWLRHRSRIKNNGADGPLTVYEVHLGSWKRSEKGGVLSYCDIASELACYVKQMGYTHVKLLPITEHPSDDSMGYGVSGYYAPTARYGKPKDLMGFVDTMHEAGIGVILDWVPTHFSRDAQTLFEFDGEPLYESGDSSGSLLRFDISRREVLSFLLSNLSFWVEKYHIDGFFLCDVDDPCFLEMVREQMRRSYADVLLLSECSHENFLWIKKESTEHLLSYLAFEPVYRKYHCDLLEAACTSAKNQSVFRFPRVSALIDTVPGDEWQRFATARAAYGYVIACTDQLIFPMGEELGQPICKNGSEQLDWELLNRDQNARLQLFFASVNQFLLAHSAFYRPDSLYSMEVKEGVLVGCRTNSNGDTLLSLINFAPDVYHEYELAVPSAGEYEEIFNSDDLSFGGSGVKNGTVLSADNSGDPQLRIAVPPLAVCVFRQKNTASSKTRPPLFSHDSI